ncbi:hypothetical protein H4R22_000701 [Coemansia sp. RSA 1290]|nr:hypothetical protein H4R22_000701 [Coemansia sp. RSA 1290]
MESYFGSQDEFDYINRFFGCQSWTGYPMPSLCVNNALSEDRQVLAKSENESNDALENQIDIDVTDGDMFTVLYPYTPVENDELAIAPGDKVRVLRTFSDGWTFVQRVDDSKIGAIPAVCLDTEP